MREPSDLQYALRSEGNWWRMETRSLNERDLDQCSQLNPNLFVPFSPDEKLAIWRKLLSLQGFAGVAITSSSAPDAKFCGGGLSVFAPQGFLSEEIARPRPGVASRFLQTLLAQSCEQLSEEQVAKQNAGRGLSILTLWGRHRPGIKSRDDINEIRLLLSDSFSESFKGYLVKQILFEIIDSDDRDFVEQSRLGRILPFEDGPDANEGADQLGLVIIEAEDLRGLPGSAIGRLFFQRRPRLLLKPMHKQLLLSAEDNATDDVLAGRLKLSVAGIKRRWADIYDHVIETAPELFQAMNDDASQDLGKRGRQKKHSILAYVKNHPEELRPFGDN
jgi:hypothetical protein